MASRSSSLQIALACDDRYAMPLATTVRSIVDHNSAHWPVSFHILSHGISEENQGRVESSLPPDSASINWIPVSLSRFDCFSTMGHISLATFARLLLPELLPPSVERVLYLDCDVLVLADLAELWRTDLEGCAAGAVRNVSFAGLDGSAPVSARSPAASGHFNAGMLLIDVDAWRSARICERAIEFLERYPDTSHSDQDALNFACEGDWLSLPNHWNFQNHFTVRLAEVNSVDRPAVVHFISGSKPWLPEARSPNAAFYDSFRSSTSFARGLSEKVSDSLIRWLAGYRNLMRRCGLLAG